MKFKTIDLKSANKEFVIIPRSGFSIVFEIKPVTDFEPYQALLKKNVVTIYTVGVGETQEPKGDTAGYWLDWLVVQALTEYYVMMTDEYGKSVISERGKPEWDTIEPENLETYTRWREELLASGFSNTELARIMQQVMTVNGLNPMAVARAREDFFQLKAAAEQAS